MLVNLSMYTTNKLQRGECFCTVFSHSFVFTQLSRSLANLARWFCENKLIRVLFVCFVIIIIIFFLPFDPSDIFIVGIFQADRILGQKIK